MLKKKLAYLIGSGISINAGMPSTKKITSHVLSGNDYSLGREGLYISSGGPIQNEWREQREAVERVIIFVKKLKEICDQYFLNSPMRRTTYEDIYYLAESITNSESMKDDPAIQQLVYHLLPTVGSLPSETDLYRWQLPEVANECTNYISDVVFDMLNREPKNIEYLENLFSPISKFVHTDIFTLNHDLVLESYFASKNKELIDGFESEAKGVRRHRKNFDLFDSNISETQESSIRLLKLHGSINWFPTDWSPNDVIRPTMLTGTRNKYYDYSSGLFADLHCRFLKYLNETDCLIICGYGFGDRVINKYVSSWHRKANDRRIIIIHGNPDELKQRMRGAIGFILDERTNFIPKYVNNLIIDDWKEI